VDGNVSSGLVALLVRSKQSKPVEEEKTAVGRSNMLESLKPKLWPNEIRQHQP
jgi:hypothetical protein